jgi:myxalamid-type polyketide synthase MxaE and MxaD
MSFDLQKWCQFYPEVGASSLFTLLAQEQQNGVENAAEQELIPEREELLAMDSGQRRQFLERYLCTQVARVLGLSSARLDLSMPLSRLGIDSLMSVELKNRISADLGTVIPVATFLQGVSSDQLITQLESSYVRLLVTSL